MRISRGSNYNILLSYVSEHTEHSAARINSLTTGSGRNAAAVIRLGPLHTLHRFTNGIDFLRDIYIYIYRKVGKQQQSRVSHVSPIYTDAIIYAMKIRGV